MNSIADWFKNLNSGSSLTSIGASNPSMTSGNITYGPGSGVEHVPFSGVVPPEVKQQMPRYSQITPEMGRVYGNPDPSWFDKFSYNMDKDFLAAVAGSIGDFNKPAMRSRGGGGGGGGGARVGGNVKPTGTMSPTLPDIPAQAPNPGFYLNLPRQQKDRYSGGF